MLTNFIKFIHLLLTLSLLGSTFFCILLIGFKKFNRPRFYQSSKVILVLALLAALTGTLLVHPRHFTFHTPWIRAAYLLMTCFALSILTLMQFNKKSKTSVNGLMTERKYGLWLVVYLFLAIMLIGVIHDAVTKTTFLYSA